MAENEPQHAESVLLIQGAVVERATRERLWDMQLGDVDLEAMAHEIAEALRLIDGADDGR